MYQESPRRGAGLVPVLWRIEESTYARAQKLSATRLIDGSSALATQAICVSRPKHSSSGTLSTYKVRRHFGPSSALRRPGGV